jgi:hypothetical protein
MIEIMSRSAGATVGVRASDKLTHADYRDVWLPALEHAMVEHKKVRALFYMDEKFRGWEMSAAWDDTKFGLSHRRDFERCALVGGPDWVRWSARMFALFLKGEVRCFPADQLEEAWTWVEAT